MKNLSYFLVLMTCFGCVEHKKIQTLELSILGNHTWTFDNYTINLRDEILEIDVVGGHYLLKKNE